MYIRFLVNTPHPRHLSAIGQKGFRDDFEFHTVQFQQFQCLEPFIELQQFQLVTEQSIEFIIFLVEQSAAVEFEFLVIE